jgi:hypothetical protein
MPSHIFTRLGLWTECINSNLASVSSAQCYAQSAGIKGHWDEELHGLDYLVYGYLQRGENNLAKKQVDYVLNMKEYTRLTLKWRMLLLQSHPDTYWKINFGQKPPI